MVSKDLADKLTEIARKQLVMSTQFKSARMDRISVYENAYLGKVQSKFRSMFNLPNLVFSGMVDSLQSDLDEEIQLRFDEGDPADYNSTKKLNVYWKSEASSLKPEARWSLKTRLDKNMAILSGRGIQKTYAENNPKYQSVFENSDYRSFHCEPKGGPILEKHLFCGEEDVFKTWESIEDAAKDGWYDAEQVALIRERTKNTDYKTIVAAAYGDKLNRFNALGQNADAHDYVGQALLNACEWGLTYKGKRYHLIFDPWTGEWLRCVPWVEDFESGLWCWTSWATHEDPKVFWSKSFADDLYPVGEAVRNLLDQELTNRQKRNMGARAYDPRYFKDIAALDAASYRPDALVSVKPPEGKTISDGLLTFETAELKGTIDLVNWVESDLGKHSGVTELNQQSLGKGKGLNVQYTMLQQAQKRIGYKAKSYRECYQEIGLRWLWGLKEHLDETRALKIAGVWEELSRKDLRTLRPIDIRVVSITEEDKQNVLGKEQKFKAIEKIIENETLLAEVSPKVVVETLLRDVGGLLDEQIRVFMDKQNYGQKDILAEADMAIKELRKGKMPEPFFDATVAFVDRIHRWELVHQNMLDPKIQNLFRDYIDIHIKGPGGNFQDSLVFQNMTYIASKIKLDNKMQGGGKDQQPGAAPAAPAAASMGKPMVRQPAMQTAPSE